MLREAGALARVDRAHGVRAAAGGEVGEVRDVLCELMHDQLIHCTDSLNMQ